MINKIIERLSALPQEYINKSITLNDEGYELLSNMRMGQAMGIEIALKEIEQIVANEKEEPTPDAVTMERHKIINLIGQIAEEAKDIKQGSLKIGSKYSADMAGAQVAVCEYIISEIKREMITEEDSKNE